MKNAHLLFHAGLVLAAGSILPAQTLYVPSGTGGIGSSTNSNVGIGTSNPGAFRLNVQGGASGDVFVGGTNSASLMLGNQSWSHAIGINSSNQFYLNSNNTPYFIASWDGTNVTLGANQTLNVIGANVGIGTSSPASPLDVTQSGTGSNYGSVRLFQPSLSSGNDISFKTGVSSTLAMNYGYQANSVAANAFGWMGLAGDAVGVGLVVRKGGNVGIGTTSPAYPLHVASAANQAMLGVGEPVASTAMLTGFRVATWDNGNVYLDTKIGSGGSIVYRYGEGSQDGSTTTWMTLKGGNVGISTTNPSHKLSVNGTIRAKEVIVDTGWSDYVFADDYRLAPLTEVEAHIKMKRHLPGIPSVAEVEAGGVSLGEMQARLLAKVEEITLHLIEIKKENAELRREIETLKHTLQP